MAPFALTTIWLALSLAFLRRQAARLESGLEDLERRPTPPDPAAETTAWVLVAARDEEPRIDGLFDALERQDWPRERIRVVLVDDASGDGTAHRARERLERFPGSLLVSGAGRGKIAALGLGVQAVKGEYILYTDADCRPGPGWIREHLRFLSAAETAAAAPSGSGPATGTAKGLWDAVCGHVRVGESSAADRLPRLESALASLQVAAGCGRGDPPFSRGGNWSLRRPFLLKAGGYAGLEHLPSGDDLHLARRLARRGARFAFLSHPEALVRTAPPAGRMDAQRQARRRYGKLPRLEAREILRQSLIGASALGTLVWPPAAILWLLAESVPSAAISSGAQSAALGALLILLAWFAALGLLWTRLKPVLARGLDLLGEEDLLVHCPKLLPRWILRSLVHGVEGSLFGSRWKDLSSKGTASRVVRSVS